MVLLKDKNKLMITLSILLLIVFISSCAESVDEYAQKPTLKKVDRIMAPHFVSGEWRYRGARAIDKGIAAYIQIPDRTGLEDKQHINYVQVTVCPKVNLTDFWEDIFPYALYIRTYNYVDRHYLETYCPSPFKLTP